ncbi:MAG: PAS domain S-box protein [Nitrospirae bacterium]|nr:PAS domain S-box protein [Nitrospirota bacterium]
MTYKLSDIFNVKELQELSDSFSRLTGAVTAVLDLDGNILTASGWQPLCTEFHRVNPITAIRCRESDTVLAGKLKAGEQYNVYRCKNGLVDVAVPIVIDKMHMGNLFTGQFFFDPPDNEYFIKQADECGFNKTEYLDALSKIPIFTEEYVKTLMDFLIRLANLIGEMGLSKKRALDKSERLFSSYLDGINAYMYIKDTDSNYTFINRKTQELFKITRADLSKRKYTDYDFFDGRMAEKLRENDRYIMDSGEHMEFEEVGYPKSIHGTKARYYLAIKFPLKDDKDNIIGVCGFSYDITQQKIISEERERFFNETLDIICIATTDGYFKQVNPMFEKVLGFTKEEIYSKPIMEFIHPDDREATIAEIEKQLKGLKTVGFENRYISKDGSYKTLSWLAGPVFEDGRIYATARDITQQKKIDTEHRMQSEVITNMEEGVALIRVSDGTITYVNPKLNNMFGYNGDELTGKHVSILNAPTYSPPEDKATQIISVLNESGCWQGEILNIKKDGTQFWCHATVSTFEHKEYGKVWVTIHQDITKRKVLENLLLKEKRFSELIINTLPGLYYLFDRTGKLILWNKNIELISGYSHDEVSQMHPLDFFTGDDRCNISAAITKSFETGEAILEANLCTKDGRYIPYYFTGTLITIEGVDYLTGVGTDISERKTIEGALRDSEEKYRLLFTHENDAIYLCDAETLEFIDANDAWSEIYGYSKAEMKGKSVVILSAEPEKTIDIRNDVINSGCARVPHRLHRRKDGTIFSVETSIGVFTYKGRKVLCIISRDITQRLQLESQNEYNAKLFDIIFEHVMDSIVLLDKDFNFIRVSKSYANVCQQDEAELIGRNHFEIYPTNFQSEAEDTKRRRVPYSVSERPFTFPDHPEWGITYWDIRLVPVLGKDMEVELFLLTLKDVTKQKLNKDALTALNETLIKRVAEEVEKSRIKDQLMYEQSRHISLGELLINISHHWRQPLCGIGLSVQDIKDAYRHGELDEQYLDNTIENAMRELNMLSDTIDNFRNFYVHDKEPKEFNISDEINKADTLLSGDVKEKSIIIDKELDESLTVHGYPHEFARVILNILTNAKDKFERRNVTGSKIKIKVYRDGTTGRKIITITDNGGAIPDDIINKVFDPYFTTKDKSRGTGMGLYMAKVIIEKNMNGSISIRNINEWCELRIEL